MRKPTVAVALFLVGSEPRMTGRPRSPWGSMSMYAPNAAGSAYCALPDGGYDPERKRSDAGPLMFE